MIGDVTEPRAAPWALLFRPVGAQFETMNRLLFAFLAGMRARKLISGYVLVLR